MWISEQEGYSAMTPIKLLQKIFFFVLNTSCTDTLTSVTLISIYEERNHLPRRSPNKSIIYALRLVYISEHVLWGKWLHLSYSNQDDGHNTCKTKHFKHSNITLKYSHFIQHSLSSVSTVTGLWAQ
jgi:hypothetical protein